VAEKFNEKITLILLDLRKYGRSSETSAPPIIAKTFKNILRKYQLLARD
jgi:hypothetical protein